MCPAVLHRLAGHDVVPLNTHLGAPGQNSIGREFCSVVGDDHSRLAAVRDDAREFAGDTRAGDRHIGNRTEAFPGHIVDNVEDAKAPAIGQLIVNKVQRPADVRPSLNQDGGPRSQGFASASALAHHQSLLAIEPVDAIDPRWLALTPQQDEQPPITEPPALVGQLPQPDAQPGVGGPARPIADHLAIRGNHGAGPTLAHLERALEKGDSLALGGGPHQ